MPMDEISKIMQAEQYQDYMIERYLLLFGEKKTLDILQNFSHPPVPSIRVNQNNIDVDALIERLQTTKKYHLEPIPWCSTGFWIYDEKAFYRYQDLGRLTEFELAPGATHEYLQGFYSLQGSSSMIPPILLDPQPGEEVLDMAAAPGSKFVQMGQAMQNKGLLVGVERSQERVAALKANIQRCGITNSVIICNDARMLGNQFERFDKVLLDAPCTGEGLMGTDPTRKNSRSVGDIETMMHIQMELLEKAVQLVRPGGRIVYSTCSMAPEEDENVINEVLKNHLTTHVVKPPEEIRDVFEPGMTKAFSVHFEPMLKHAVRVFPYNHPTRPEGFFAAIIEKEERR